MAEGLNRVMLLGNIGADPELKATAGGQSILKLRLATSESFKDRNGERQERTEWHSVVVWGKRAEVLDNLLRKGSRVFIEGSLRTSSFEVEGQKRYRTEIVAREIILAGSAQGAQGAEGSYSRSAQPKTSQGGGYSEADYGGHDDDIPF